MSYKSSGVFLKAALWVVLVIGIAFSVRTGCHLTSWLTYMMFSKPVEAVIEESYPYSMTVRKPRPTRYVERYRGTYGFDLQESAGKTAHFTGKFNDSYFLSIDRENLQKGDRLMVRYLSFNPSWSRPEEEFGLTQLAIAGFFFLVSAICGGICAWLLWFFWRPPNKA
jgi:hypothetical protein